MDSIDINIPMCTRDLLQSHKGVYALMEEPKDIPVGAFVRIICNGEVLDSGVVSLIEPPGTNSRPEMEKDFLQWWKLHYDPANESTDTNVQAPANSGQQTATGGEPVGDNSKGTQNQGTKEQ